MLDATKLTDLELNTLKSHSTANRLSLQLTCASRKHCNGCGYHRLCIFYRDLWIISNKELHRRLGKGGVTMRYLVDQMPTLPIECPFCSSPNLFGDYTCNLTNGLCGRFTSCPFPREVPYSCDGLIAVPGLITRPELREALAEAVKRA